MSQRDEWVYMAKLAEQTERYEEMVEYMTKVAVSCAETKKENVMTLEERNLLSVAYKNVIGARRAAWRVISTLEAKQDDKDNPHGGEKFAPELLKKYRLEIEEQLRKTCHEILDTLANIVIPKEEGVDAKVFFLKMRGDYYRYIAEIEMSPSSDVVEEVPSGKESEKAYKEAQEIAKDLPPTHPIRLGLALNFSVYYYEIKKDPQMACKYAKEAFDDAIAELDGLSEDSYKDSTLIMQLLRDNLTLWSSEDTTEEDKQDTVVQDIEQDD